MYKPSKMLLQILMNNGFKNVTYHFAKQHKNFLTQSTDIYDPKKHKFALSPVKGKSKFNLFLDYTSIEITFGGRCRLITNANLNCEELKSIIAFFKMSYERRYLIADLTDCQIEQSWKMLNEFKERFNRYEYPLDEKFESAFNNCTLNI